MLAYLGIRSEPSDKSALLRIGREGHFLGGKNYDMTHEWSSLPKGPTLQLLLEWKKREIFLIRKYFLKLFLSLMEYMYII